MSKVWLVTGATKGIGKAIMLAALKAGDCVVGTSRKTNGISVPSEYNDRLLNIQLDISCSDSAVYQDMVNAAVAKFGRIDVLVNNAGYGAITGFEETSEKTIRDLFEVNLFGTMRVTRAVLPIMRRQHSGHILNISSGAGYSAGPVPYHTSKFAVTGFSTSLAFEVEPFGIHVTNVAPGLFRTNFYDENTWGTQPDVHIADYDAFRWQTAFIVEAHKHEQPGDPNKLASLLIEVVNTDNPPLHLPVGEDAPAVLDALCEKLQADMKLWRNKSIRTSF